MAKETSARKKPPPPEGVSKMDLWKVPFTKMAIPEYDQNGNKVRLNIREDFGDTEAFGEDLYHNGVKYLMSGYRIPGTEVYYVTDGERRYRAMAYVYKKYKKDLEAKFIVEPKGGLTNKERIVNLFVANAGKDFTPMEKVEGIRRLRLENMSDAEIARNLGVSGGYVSRLAKLIEAPAELIHLIKTGKIGPMEASDEMVKDRAKEFLEDYKNGKYDQAVQKAATSSGPGEVAKLSKQAPITKTVIRKVKEEKVNAEVSVTVNSWAVLKSVVNSLNPKKIQDPEKSKTLIFICKIMENKMTRIQIENYFK